MNDIVVIVTGATGSAGRAVCAALAGAGATVIGVGHDPDRLAELGNAIPGIDTYEVDLSDGAAVRELVGTVRSAHGRIDGLAHLVGGWRGGATFGANTDADWAFLSAGLVDTLRHVTLALHDDLVDSPAGRAVIVSSTAVDNPTAGSANYVAAKAAGEAWMLSLADSLRRNQSGRRTDPVPQTSAAAVLVIKALVDDAMRAAEPTRSFPGFTDVDELARQVLDLWSQDAATLNGARIVLTG